MPGKRSPVTEYPTPLPVPTATLVGYPEADDGPEDSRRYQVMMVRLKKPEDEIRPNVLIGGIFQAGQGVHHSLRDVIRSELFEESGLRIVEGFQPVHFATSVRCDADPRYWCSFPTIMGVPDFIMAAPLVGEIAPQDEAEVREAFWADVREIDLGTVGRGHDLIIRLWRVICDFGGLTPRLFEKDAIRAISALSSERYVVSLNEFNRMVYLEDRYSVLDWRSILSTT